jgi:hypothetical protein
MGRTVTKTSVFQRSEYGMGETSAVSSLQYFASPYASIQPVDGKKDLYGVRASLSP